MPCAILTTLKCCVWNAAVCVCECIYGVIQTVENEKGNEKREVILLSVFLGNKTYLLLSFAKNGVVIVS